MGRVANKIAYVHKLSLLCLHRQTEEIDHPIDFFLSAF